LTLNSYLIAIISNQAGIALKSDSKAPKAHQGRLTAFKSKVSAVFGQLDLPISIYAATEKDLYRKPRTGMWKDLLEDHDLNPGSVDLENSFFVGDAGGRIAGIGLAKDFSSSDRYSIAIRPAVV
jgi:bifunctional polynucleotide phosphatase/kinase